MEEEEKLGRAWGSGFWGTDLLITTPPDSALDRHGSLPIPRAGHWSGTVNPCSGLSQICPLSMQHLPTSQLEICFDPGSVLAIRYRGLVPGFSAEV